jgi:hypothetical protein
MFGRTALGLILMLVMAAPATAQTSNAPCPALKTKLRLTDGNTIEAIKDLGGGVCRFKSQKDGKTFERILGAFLSNDPNFERTRGLVPLEVGKKLEFQVSGADDKGQPTNWLNTLAVEKYEKTTSPAGTFDAFVILSQTRLFSGGGTWERRFWYAPDVGYVVNSKYTMVQGTPPRRVPSDWYVVEIIK